MERRSPTAGVLENENDDLNLRLGLPGRDESPTPEQQPSSSSSSYSLKRSSSEMENEVAESAAPPPKAQIVGWPPVRPYRKSMLKQAELVKVSMDGAPYLRKIDLNLYKNYMDLLKALEGMFKCTTPISIAIASDFAPTYQDKDGDWMLVGDVPWEMFISSCKRLRIIKASEAKGLAASF